MRKVILNITTSLDGYIAKEDGCCDCLVGIDENKSEAPYKCNYDEFLAQIDTVVMGRVCYDQEMYKSFTDKEVYVATTKDMKDHDNIHFIGKEVVDFIRKEREKEGKDIYIFGGGKLADAFIRENLIDEYIISIVPMILGDGIPLFHKGEHTLELKLKDKCEENGVVSLKYCRRCD